MTTTDREVVDVIKPGLDLLTRDGDRIGHIDELAPEYLIVSETEYGERVYVPRSAVSREADDAMYLDVDRDGFAALASTEPMGAPVGSTRDMAETTTGSDRDRIRVHEEELTAQKSARESGAVEITKQVVEEQKTIDVPVTREEVHVRRVPAGETTTTDASDAFQSDSVRVPIMEEQVEVRKQPRVVEELEISKDQVQGTQQVSDTVRREEVNVEERGNVDIDRR
jgi:uncharacterized protein (TIGR02271 family)